MRVLLASSKTDFLSSSTDIGAWSPQLPNKVGIANLVIVNLLMKLNNNKVSYFFGFFEHTRIMNYSINLDE